MEETIILTALNNTTNAPLYFNELVKLINEVTTASERNVMNKLTKMRKVDLITTTDGRNFNITKKGKEHLKSLQPKSTTQKITLHLQEDLPKHIIKISYLFFGFLLKYVYDLI